MNNAVSPCKAPAGSLSTRANSKHLLGYFTADVGSTEELVHRGRFNGHADRRAFWKRLFADTDFLMLAACIGQLSQTQQV